MVIIEEVITEAHTEEWGVWKGGEKKHILCLFPRDSDSVGLSWGQKSTILIKTCNSDADGSCLTLCM